MDLLEDLQKMPRVLDADFVIQWAIAPTATSSIIMGNTSPSVEPFRANTYRQDTLSGSFLNINKNLLRILSQRLNDQELKEVLSI